MSEDVLYTTRWVDTTRKPAPGHRWLSVEEARDAWNAGYEARGLVTVVDAVKRDEDGNPRARWVIGGSSTGRVRVRFFTPGGSVQRSTDYDVIDGRLWRWISVTYVYPDQENRYYEFQTLRKITEEFRPDGTGTVEFDEKDESVLHTARLTGAPVSGFWLDRPEFGDWSHLTNPEYGVPTDKPWAQPS